MFLDTHYGYLVGHFGILRSVTLLDMGEFVFGIEDYFGETDDNIGANIRYEGPKVAGVE